MSWLLLLSPNNSYTGIILVPLNTEFPLKVTVLKSDPCIENWLKPLKHPFISIDKLPYTLNKLVHPVNVFLIWNTLSLVNYISWTLVLFWILNVVNSLNLDTSNNVLSKGHKISANAKNEDIYSSFDEAFKKFITQLGKEKDKLISNKKQGK